jgi:hypothetical protein
MDKLNYRPQFSGHTKKNLRCLVERKEHSAFTGGKANVLTKVKGKFSAWMVCA